MADFSLTDGADRLRGTGSDDTFSGGTLSREDRISGGGGFDTLIADLAADLSGPETPRISFVERLLINGQGGELSLRGVRGVEEVIANGSDLFLRDAGLGVTYGARDVASGTVTIDFRSDLSGGGDTLSLLSDDANLAFKAGSDQQNSGIERIELAAIGTEDAAEDVDISAFTSLQELTVTGENGVLLDVVSDVFSRLDASENTGGVELTSFNSASQDLEFIGSQGDDVLRTGTGNDTITGNDGDDEIDGEAGDDVIDGGVGDDVLNGNAGDDEVSGGDGNDEIDGGGGVDILTGGAGDDIIDGGNGDDEIEGGDGNDELTGGDGDDLIVAGAGDDLLTGGGGADTFVFSGGDDEVTDFVVGTDILRFGGTDISTQQDILDNRGSITSMDSEGLTLELNGASVTISIDTDFLMMG
ncbi:calcium-binding protein [Jannaschia sp. LMIT008]|uniref:calcium-binding protein n=1 Tax=Jannaschia maritima TaxID=3032585 RepID=UPI0028118117|nr:calcium-binding protein [Jannaschia sp. LMIT008]